LIPNKRYTPAFTVCFFTVQDVPLSLLPKNLLDLADLFLNFAGHCITIPAGGDHKVSLVLNSAYSM
jgi:hypothetical protein